MHTMIEITLGELKFDCRVSGNNDDPLIIFLHGFPETSYMWRHLMTAISEMGFYCVAPNLRGYSKGACPKSKKHYTIKILASDVIEISRHFQSSKFHLVGHDWGAAIGWQLVHDYPRSILSWTAISVPHLQAFGEAIVNDVQQRKMSRYIKAFQWPFLPELKIRKNDFRLFRKLWKHSEQDEVEAYLEVFRNPRQLTAAMNYYRSNYRLLKTAAHNEIMGDIHVPTLFIWGKTDKAIGRFAVQNSHQYMKNEYEFIALNAGHWLVQTQFDRLKKAISHHILKFKSN